ncbi:MAG: transposase [Acidimicrobiales bacterium]|nr:transposase [Acidimicrobiales bacterium]
MIPVNLSELPAYMRDENEAWLLLERLRWDGRPVCPHCGTIDEKHYFIASRSGERRTKAGNVTYRRLWKCREKNCRKNFSVLIGTVFEDSRVPVSKWLFALYLFAAAKNAISAKELERQLGVSYPTAWFMLHRLRAAAGRDPLAPLMSGTVVVDETFIGGKPKNKHQQGRNKGPTGPAARAAARASGVSLHGGRGGGNAHMQPVVALIDRETGEVRTKVVTDVNSDTLRATIAEQVDMPETVLYTDGAKAYRPIGRDMAGHAWVDHGSAEYVRGEVTTNQCESFFAQFKRSLDGTYHAVSRKHLHRYADEFAMRWNTSDLKDAQRVQAIVDMTIGKRLTYRPLTQGC